MGSMSRDQLIVYILERRRKRARPVPPMTGPAVRLAPGRELFYILRAYGTGWDVYGFAHDLDRARKRATQVGWVVRARDRETAHRLLYYHIKNGHRPAGNGRSIWRGTKS